MVVVVVAVGVVVAVVVGVVVGVAVVVGVNLNEIPVLHCPPRHGRFPPRR